MCIAVMLINALFSSTQAELEKKAAKHHDWWIANASPRIADIAGTILFLCARVFSRDAKVFPED